MNNKLTKLEKQWVLYDVGNSAFTLLEATIMPIYFNSISSAAGLAEVDYLAYWGYSASISTLIVAFLGPVLGTMADNKGFKKIIFTAAMLVGSIGLSVLWVPKSWQVFLALYIFAKV
ncbi:MAG: MFS transporter, partial [Erysipelotrichaceae bacterium]|nr:MFS transporter [Erysipelotrichaceae bacterium]